MGETLSYASIIEIIMILASAYLSFKTTKKEIRDSNHFTWDAIEEVAILFIGIFITMIPALLILKARGADLGLTQPRQFFWIPEHYQASLITRQLTWYSLLPQLLLDLAPVYKH